MKTKLCPKCQELKPLKSFSPTAREQKGKWCNLCSRKSERQKRIKAILKLGGQCTCCGETTLEFLTFDHVHGNGNAHRKVMGRFMARWILSPEYQEGTIQILCWNCNAAKAYYGICPHQRRQK